MSGSIFLPPLQTRLVTIAAHVDHGKTTLADNLIEANGIISERLAGTIRYLDSDPEEQRRGITIRSSAIGLKHTVTTSNNNKTNETHATASPDRLIHLLDSPGHSDFSLEVTSALAACDGCLLVVDAIEGMCARTHQVFREAYTNQLTPVLVINKLDRMCTDLMLTPTEAYLRLRSLIENVNAAASAMLTSARHQSHSSDDTTTAAATTCPDMPELTVQEQYWTFDPAKGNVVFASALFGWGFTVQSVARSLFRSKLVQMKPVQLRQCLFGDYKFGKDGKLLKWKTASADAPIFAVYALQPIWDIYQGVASAAAAVGLGSSVNNSGNDNGNENNSKSKIKASVPGMDQVLAALQVGATGTTAITTTDEMQAILTKTGANTEDAVLRSILRRYRPLADTVLDTVSDYLPSPQQAAESVRSRVLSLQTPTVVTPEFERIQGAVARCDASAEAPVVAHVCKFIATDRVHIRDPDLPADEESNSSNLILGLARVLCGRLRTDGEYFLMGPKHTQDVTAPKRVVRLYLLMGSTFVRVDEVPAGHLCAVYNLEDIQLKTVTLSDSLHCMPMRGLERGARPLVKVNVEPEDQSETDALERGLVKLSLADAAVEVTATAKGERILACLGELHLEQSILELKTVYCGKEIKLRISDPIVDFGETSKYLLLHHLFSANMDS